LEEFDRCMINVSVSECVIVCESVNVWASVCVCVIEIVW